MDHRPPTAHCHHHVKGERIPLRLPHDCPSLDRLDPWSFPSIQNNTKKNRPFAPRLLHQQSFYWDLSMEICLKGIPGGIVHELAATAISYISHLCLDANSWKHCQEAWQEILVSLFITFKTLFHKNTKSPQSLPTAKDLMALLNRGNQKG